MVWLHATHAPHRAVRAWTHRELWEKHRAWQLSGPSARPQPSQGSHAQLHPRGASILAGPLSHTQAFNTRRPELVPPLGPRNCARQRRSLLCTTGGNQPREREGLVQGHPETALKPGLLDPIPGSFHPSGSVRGSPVNLTQTECPTARPGNKNICAFPPHFTDEETEAQSGPCFAHDLPGRRDGEAAAGPWAAWPWNHHTSLLQALPQKCVGSWGVGGRTSLAGTVWGSSLMSRTDGADRPDTRRVSALPTFSNLSGTNPPISAKQQPKARGHIAWPPRDG